jgi:hypothetical protein
VKKLFQFSRPKGPGFGISKDYYLSVLASSSVLPSLLDIVNPKGQNGSIPGFGVPLAASATKDDLGEPLRRGAFGLASPDRKTVLRMLVLGRDEAGFDPDVLSRVPMGATLPTELVNRVRGTWNLLQLTFESHDPEVYPALDFLLAVAIRIAKLSEGVIADAISERYLLPEDVLPPVRLDPKVDAREHIAPGFFVASDGGHAYTKGLRKFALPELEMPGLLPSDEQDASRFLLALSQLILLGDLAEPGDRVGATKAQFQIAEGGFDRSRWEGIPVFELLPPTTMTSSEALSKWIEESGRMSR